MCCSVGYHFTFLLVSFDAQRFSNLIKSNLPNFPFVTCFNVVSKKPLHNQRSQKFTPMFSSRRFIVLTLTFGLVIHFELIFAYVKK